ncbi:hypothetical protein [Candidatus Cryosericum septentrionale]|jgi:hypothetical protein|uniref:WD40 repeat domain-containing protein n=1 Tax=Candidatus Cryosericum septentrionale TaxID=2290913 RepID=A0A398E4R4_9BACT|nr:hypothetical protein [Candidatus Cryosericum septentrionale]RIE17611.1 hypothetical protein SMC1_00040 [Candidatus Cryosericum septentrionale]
MKKTVQSHGLRHMTLDYQRWLAAFVIVAATLGAMTLWALRGKETALHVVSQFKTSDYPIGIVGTQDQGYALTAAGQVFALRGWTSQSEGVELGDNPTSLTLSTSGKYLLVSGQRLTLLDDALRQKWSRTTTAPSVVEQAVFTVTGGVAVVYSFLANQSRQFVTYDLAGKYQDGYTVPDFGRGSQISLAHSGMLVVTLESGTIYTVSPQGKVIAKFTVPNPDQKLAGLVTVVDDSGTRILAGYGRSVSGAPGPLPRYLFDQTGKRIAQIVATSDNPGLRALGNDFLTFGRTAEIFDKDGKLLLSASKLNFNTIDASMSDGECALLFQEQTTSQTAVYFLGIYDMKARALVRQWSTAESDEVRVFQLPGMRSALALGSGFSILAP